METVELKELVAACVRKERKAQHMFFKAYYGKMLSVCLRYIKDRDSAQEVVQDGFIKVFDKLELFDFRGSIEGWMRRIFSNTAIDAIRKAKRNPFLSDQDNDFKVPAENIMEEREALEELQVNMRLPLIVSIACLLHIAPYLTCMCLRSILIKKSLKS